MTTGVPRLLDLRGKAEPDLTLVVEHLEAGGLLAYPTETVYGLGGPCTPEAVDAVRRIKGREEGKPLLVLVASAERAGRAREGAA